MVITQGRDNPDAADQKFFVLFDDASGDFGVLDAQVAEGCLVAVFSFIKAYGYTVDDLVGAALTYQRFNLLGFIRADIVFSQHRFDVLQTLRDDFCIIRGTVHAQQVLKHVDGYICPFLDELGQILAYNTPGKVLVQQMIEVFIEFDVHACLLLKEIISEGQVYRDPVALQLGIQILVVDDQEIISLAIKVTACQR